MPRRHDYYDDVSEYSAAPSRRRDRDRVVETEEIDIRERRGGRERETDFLRDDYARSSAGPLVLREEEVIEERVKPKRKHRPREVVEEEEVLVARSGSGGRGGSREEISYRRERDRERERPVEREEVREEIIYQPRERELPYAREREEFFYRPRERSPPAIAREKEEYVFAPRRRAVSVDREEISIRERRGERENERPQGRDRGFEREELVIRRDERERERPRERDYKEEELIIRRDDRDATSTRGGYERDEIIMRERSRERVRPRDDYESEQITIRRDERERPRERDYREQELVVRRDERERPRERDYKEEEITISRNERERPRQRDYKEDELIIRRDERERPRERDRGFQEEDIIIRRDERDGGRRGDRDTKQEEIIIRRQERSPSPEFIPPPPEPEPIRAPPIHQEIITHHRHIDHGYETRAPVPAPPPPRRSPSPKNAYDEIEIHRRGEHNGHRYDDDIIIDTRRKGTPTSAPPAPLVRRRSASAGPPARSRYDPIADEADYYARRANERAYMGEAYNGATRDWAIVDVPPGTNRVKMDGIGGASQEITWQRYNGVRRSNFVAEDERYGELERVEERGLDKGRRFVGQRDKRESMWTEITKDLVVREAIEGCGYDFEETEFFYYVMEYLRYEDVLRLVEISESLRRDRRDRIRQIEWEQTHAPVERPKKLLAAQPWDEERVFEREIIYDRPPPPRPLTPVRREVREKTYVLR